MVIIEILSGIPCAGKTTYTENRKKCDLLGKIKSISRDEIRKDFFINYKFTSRNEDIVTEIFYHQLDMIIEDLSQFDFTIILDNTHCKEGFIDNIIRNYSGKGKIKIKFFEIPLYKAYCRNIIRYLRIGKFVPFKFIKIMKANFDKINRDKYQTYIY